MKYLCLLIFFILSLYSHSFSFTLNSKQPTCFNLKPAHRYYLTFTSTGSHDKQVKFSVLNNGIEILKKENINEFMQEVEFAPGSASICVQTSSSSEKLITLAMINLDLEIQSKIIDRKDLMYVERNLHKALNYVGELSKLAEAKMQTNIMNRNRLEKSEKKVKWAGIIKIVFLLAAVGLQLLIARVLLKNSNTYQPIQP